MPIFLPSTDSKCIIQHTVHVVHTCVISIKDGQKYFFAQRSKTTLFPDDINGFVEPDVINYFLATIYS